MLDDTRDFLVRYGLPAARNYYSAENALTRAYRRAGRSLAGCQLQAILAVRRACEVAVAIDALADRAAAETGKSKSKIRSDVSARTIINGVHRPGALERVGGVANAYKHGSIDSARHPITSFGAVLAAGAGHGVDGFGIGKFGGVEVLLSLTNGTKRKFLGDVPYSIAGWFAFLNANGATLARRRVVVCNLQVFP